MAGLFAKAKKAKSEEVGTSKSKGIQWNVGKPGTDPIGTAVHQLMVLQAEAKAIEAKMGLAKTMVKNHATEKFIAAYVEAGAMPDSPMRVVNADGESVAFVAQDRSSQYAVKPEQMTALNELLGEDAADGLVYEEVSFGLNREILALPGVQEVVEKALEGALKKLTSGEKPILNAEQAEMLLDVKLQTSFKPKMLDRLVLICGKCVNRVQQLLGAMGSCATLYVKV